MPQIPLSEAFGLDVDGKLADSIKLKVGVSLSSARNSGPSMRSHTTTATAARSTLND
jgi:hypothetical protein